MSGTEAEVTGSETPKRVTSGKTKGTTRVYSEVPPGSYWAILKAVDVRQLSGSSDPMLVLSFEAYHPKKGLIQYAVRGVFRNAGRLIDVTRSMLIPACIAHEQVATLDQCKTLIASRIGDRFLVAFTYALSNRHHLLGLLNAIPSKPRARKKVAKVVAGARRTKTK